MRITFLRSELRNLNIRIQSVLGPVVATRYRNIPHKVCPQKKTHTNILWRTFHCAFFAGISCGGHSCIFLVLTSHANLGDLSNMNTGFTILTIVAVSGFQWLTSLSQVNWIICGILSNPCVTARQGWGHHTHHPHSKCERGKDNTDKQYCKGKKAKQWCDRKKDTSSAVEQKWTK